MSDTWEVSGALQLLDGRAGGKVQKPRNTVSVPCSLNGNAY